MQNMFILVLMMIIDMLFTADESKDVLLSFYCTHLLIKGTLESVRKSYKLALSAIRRQY
jgi:hypothetical protein